MKMSDLLLPLFTTFLNDLLGIPMMPWIFLAWDSKCARSDFRPEYTWKMQKFK